LGQHIKAAIFVQMNIEKFVAVVYSRKSIRILFHLLFWVLLGGVQWYLSRISFGPYKYFPTYVFILYLVTDILGTAFFYYPFVYFILPRTIYKRKIIAGIFYTFCLVVLYALFDIARENYVLGTCKPCMAELKVSNPRYYQFLQDSLIPRMFGKVVSMGTLIGLLFAIAFPLSIKLGLQAFREQLRSVQLQRDNLQLEFNFLRSQVNPHFLFNTLNNIYGKILNDEKEKSAGLVARLSQVLRYTLYQSGSATVAIEEEVQVLRDYIDLETVRLNHVKVNFEYTSDGSVTTIAPLLMMPVVENAFKYCTDAEGAYIDISLVVAEKQIHFCSRNFVDPDRQSTPGGGIGLTNFSKRLKLYYPDKHQYTVTKPGSEYAVTVNINCHE
jgi:hypothetical protein